MSMRYLCKVAAICTLVLPTLSPIHSHALGEGPYAEYYEGLKALADKDCQLAVKKFTNFRERNSEKIEQYRDFFSVINAAIEFCENEPHSLPGASEFFGASRG